MFTTQLTPKVMSEWDELINTQVKSDPPFMTCGYIWRGFGENEVEWHLSVGRFGVEMEEDLENIQTEWQFCVGRGLRENEAE